MKKRILVLTLLSALTLYGCGRDNDNSSTTAGTDVPTANPSPTPTSTSNVLAVGTYGNAQLLMTVSRTKTTFVFGCGTGLVRGRIHLDENGNFSKQGSFTPGGGPTPENPPPRFFATYTGTVNADQSQVNLTVSHLNFTGDQVTESYQLVRGGTGPEIHCL
jgi:hypothetical protein